MRTFPGAAPDLLESEGVVRLMRAGRWGLTAVETTLSALLILWWRQRPLSAFLAMAILFGYNVVVLAILQRAPLSQIRVRLLLALDLLLLGNVSLWTGGSKSPFLGQCYLITLVAALFYNLPGGLVCGSAAGLLSVALAWTQERFTGESPVWEIVRDTAPYYVIVGGFTGFLVGQLKTWFARYHEQEQQAEVRRREMELARSVQRSSLPLTAPAVPGLEVAVRAVPSREVGGDFHAFAVDTSGARLGVAIGDVAGKGMAAALVATSIGYLLPYLRPLDNPQAALQRLNADLVARLPDASFASLLYAEIAPEANGVTIFNAGHPPALRWRAADGSVTETACGDAPPLGMFPSWSGRAQRLDLASGDLLLLCSDGLLEVRDAEGAEFGSARTARILAEQASRGPDAVADALLAAVQAWGAPSDDLTLILCQRTVGYPGF